MPEVQEVFDMATQKARPDPGALERQHRQQQRRSAMQKTAVFVLIGALVIGGAVLVLSALRSDQGRGDNVGSDPTIAPIPTVGDGPLEPGRYVISDTGASQVISIEVPEGYSGVSGQAILKDGLEETGVGVWGVGAIFDDACEWRGTQTIVLSTQEVVDNLAGQKALRPTRPTDVTVGGNVTAGGNVGTYLELTLPAGADPGRCDGGEFRLWASGGGDRRYLDNPGQTELLWILNQDLVIDAPLSPDASAQDRAEVLDMVESIRIEPQ